jgi:cytochrome P450
MAFLEELRAHQRAGGPDQDEAQVACVREWLHARPDALFRELRAHAPTLVVGRLAFVTRFDDVADVLRRGDAFSVQPYAEAITRINRGPNFLLGMDEGPEYEAQRSRLSRVFRREDAPRVRDIVAARSAEIVAAARGKGRLDLADGFGRLVPALFVGDYFGVPGPDARTLIRWARAIFTDGFVNVLRLPLLTRRAMRESSGFRTYLDRLIAARRADLARGVGPRDDVLGRLLEDMGPDNGDVRDQAMGQVRDALLWCTAGMIDNVNTAVCRAMDYLLDHQDVLASARDAAVNGDHPLLRAHLFEALRFCTPTPVVTRRCVRAHTLSPGTSHETRLAGGTLTFAGLGAAMMDDAIVERPAEFRLHRPEAHYLHFGAGLHACLGRHVAEAHLTGMVHTLLTLPAMRRAPGLAGRLRTDGPFPKSLVVRFDGAGAAGR